MNAEDLAGRISDRNATITVVGQGYVGLPLAVEFARAGFKVHGLDTERERIEMLAEGRSPTPDVKHEHLRGMLDGGRYLPTLDHAVMKDSDVIIICVPTPLRKSKDPDISYVVAAAEQVAAHLRAGQLVVLESTTYPGTTEELLRPLFESPERIVGRDIFLAYSPERIDPGNVKFTVKDIPKIVGGITPECTRLAALLYRQIVSSVTEVSGPRVAELAKLYENVFRNVNIALANEFAFICRHLGVHSREVIDAASTKPFGFLPFFPGPGIGGHCIPVDPAFLAWKTRLNGYEARFIQLADEINRSMPAYVVQLVSEALNARSLCLNGAHVLLLGIAYKRNVGDTRESPALEVITRLREKGALVSYADPHVPSVLVEGSSMAAVEAGAPAYAGADCTVILTDHSDFDYKMVTDISPLVIDMRNATWGLSVPEHRVVRL